MLAVVGALLGVGARVADAEPATELADDDARAAARVAGRGRGVDRADRGDGTGGRRDTRDVPVVQLARMARSLEVVVDTTIGGHGRATPARLATT